MSTQAEVLATADIAYGAVESQRLRHELEKGERVAVGTTRILDRVGRSSVRVRVIGENSLGWLEAAKDWGCNVEAFVCPNTKITKLATQLIPQVTIKTPTEAVHMPPRSKWDGIMLGNVLNKSDALLFDNLFGRWQPLAACLSFPAHFLRSEVIKLLPPTESPYVKKFHKCLHSKFGGVTTSDWHVITYSRSIVFEDVAKIRRGIADCFE